MRARILVLVAAAVMAAAAPARAWCEASCLVTISGNQSHCPSHEPAHSEPQVAGTAIDECPVLESARTTAPARLGASAGTSVTPAPELRPRVRLLFSPVRPSSASTMFERCTPLRI